MSITFTEAQAITNVSTLKAAIIAAVPGFPSGNTAEQNQPLVRSFVQGTSTSTNQTSVLDYQKQVVNLNNPTLDVFKVKCRFLYIDMAGADPDHMDFLLSFNRADLTTP